jgi:type I restriction enzyme, S subunit
LKKNNKLPKGWLKTELKNCTDILDSKRIPINSTERAKRKGTIPYYGATGQVGWIDDYIFDDELVLLGEDGAPFLEIYKDTAYMIHGKSWVNNHAHVLKGTKQVMNSKLLCYYLNQFNYMDFISGTTRLKLNQTSMKKIPILLPPFSEQKRIILKIEELFSKMDSIQQLLKYVELQLEPYKQSILKSIFSKYEKKPLSDITKITSGFTFKSKDFTNKGIPVVKIANVGYGKFVEKNQEYLPKQFLKQHDDFIVQQKTILIALTRPITNNMLKVCEYPENIPSLLNQRVAKIETLKNYNQKLLLFYFQSLDFRKQVTSSVIGTEQPNLSPLKLAEFLCPILPLEKQNDVCFQLEQLFDQIKNSQNTINSSLQFLQTMKISILKKAFEGKLIPQDPKDESAEILLQRIKAEK